MWNGFTSEAIKNLQRRFYWLGGIHLIVGLIALALPMVASFTIAAFVGVMLLLLGIMQGWNVYIGFRDGDKAWLLLLSSLAATVTGCIFILRPLTGVITLSILLSFYLLMDGVVKIGEYYRLRRLKGSFWLLFSGILSIILAMLLWSNIWDGLSLLGILFGVHVIFSGATLIVMAWNCSAEESYYDI